MKPESYMKKRIPSNYGTFIYSSIDPGAEAGQLSSGTYSLSSLSTIPYVSLRGLSSKEKLFSWNEPIEIPEGASATIVNKSAHRGDIAINGGADWGSRPDRVTVPFTLLQSGNDLMPVYSNADGNDVPGWVDTRRCRRAWAVINILAVSGIRLCDRRACEHPFSQQQLPRR